MVVGSVAWSRGRAYTSGVSRGRVSPRTRPTPGAALLARLVRLAVLVALALQLTGALHVAIDTLSLSADEARAHVADDDDDGDCPPGCPTCHHANGGVAAPPPPGIEQITPAFVLQDHRRSVPFLRPPTPALDTLFRPPRSLMVVALG